MKKIPLPKGLFALCDDEDYEYLMQWDWHVSGSSPKNRPYARRRILKNEKNILGEYQGIRMHRLLMNPPKDMVIDHKNGNTLDNQKHNLEIVTQEENMRRVPTWCKKK